ncbi:MAG: helix-turn-helix transcriptional regulator [Vicinamibacterales bacterium]
MSDSLPARDRLDSWKAIAEYLRRDLATVRRWEKHRGLPVRRVAGNGRSVFAYTSELDAWLEGSRAAARAGDAGPIREAPDLPAVETVGLLVARGRAWRFWAAGALVAAAAVGVWRLQARAADTGPLRFEATPRGVSAFDGTGRERWHYAFPKDEQVVPLDFESSLQVVGGEAPEILVARAASYAQRGTVGKEGVLTWLGGDGAFRRSFAFDDRVTVGGKPFGPPWAMTSFAVDESRGRRRIAVTAHHWNWEPGLVTVLDDAWVRRGTFVHAGWIERVRWLTPDRLLISGFSNPQDGGMVGLMDPARLDAPLRMVALPRSEVNLATKSRFNRALVEINSDRIIARTIEADPPDKGVHGAIEALYEFAPGLTLLRASFGEQYWIAHRELEQKGVLDHSREHCPDRDGPRAIRVWEPATGWRTVPVPGQ